MPEIAAGELRNQTGDVRRRPIARDELAQRLHRAQADPGLRQDLAVIAAETTDDLGPIH